MSKSKSIEIGIVGCGAIGTGVALYIEKKLSSSAVVSALADKDIRAAKILQRKLCCRPKIYDIATLVEKVDLVIEAASIAGASFLLKKAITCRKDIVILSVGALINKTNILREAARKKVNIYVSSGAIVGVDGIGALSLGSIKKISLTTSKPPGGLIGADYLKKKKINLTNLKKEKVVFRGSVKEAIRYFPKNINVAGTLLLTSASKNIEVCIKADPNIKRNIHRIEVDAVEAKLSIEVNNIPSKSNPKTSALAILSTQQLLRKIFSPLKIGS